MKTRENKIQYNSGLAFLVTVLVVAVIFYCNDSIQAKTPVPDSLNADISVKNRPLNEVVNLVQEQTGYKIKLESIDESLLVTGQFRKAAVETIFTRLLKGYNISVTTDTTDKLISVISLGGKIQVAKGSKELKSTVNIASDMDANASDDVASAELPDMASFVDLTDPDIQKLQVQQTKELEQQQNNPNTVDPLTGMTLSALNDLLKKQNIDLNQDIK